MVSAGSKFHAYADSLGNSSVFWVDTLSFKLNGSFVKGDVLELRDFVINQTKVTFNVETIDESLLDKEIIDIVVPVSLVGLDQETVLAPHPNILAQLSDVRNDNRIFLLLLKVPHNKKTKIRIPLPNTGNIVEYWYHGL